VQKQYARTEAALDGYNGDTLDCLGWEIARKEKTTTSALERSSKEQPP